MTEDTLNPVALDAPTTVETPAIHADERNAINPMVRRFLFVDVASLRAKQLRKGALNRIALAVAAGETTVRETGLKPERVAMEEVRRGYVSYDLPEPVAPVKEG